MGHKGVKSLRVHDSDLGNTVTMVTTVHGNIVYVR